MDIAKLATATSAMLVGFNADDMSTAVTASTNATENNAFWFAVLAIYKAVDIGMAIYDSYQLIKEFTSEETTDQRRQEIAQELMVDGTLSALGTRAAGKLFNAVENKLGMSEEVLRNKLKDKLPNKGEQIETAGSTNPNGQGSRADREPSEEGVREYIYNNPSKHKQELERQENLPWKKIDFNALENFGKMSFEDLEHIFKRNGYSIETSIKAQSSGKAQAFRITSNNGAPIKPGEPKLIQVHPGGGRHNSSYHKIDFMGDDKNQKKGKTSYIFNKDGDENGEIFTSAGRSEATTSYYHVDGREIVFVDGAWRYKL